MFGKPKDNDLTREILANNEALYQPTPTDRLTIGRCGYCQHPIYSGRLVGNGMLNEEPRCSHCGAQPFPVKMMDRRVGERRGHVTTSDGIVHAIKRDRRR